MRLFALSLLVVALIPGCKKEQEWGIASFVEGNDLVKICGSNLREDQIACYYYVFGVVDSYESSYQEKNGKEWLCGAPASGDLVDAVVNHLRAHPDLGSRTAASIVERSVNKAFGCDYKEQK